MRDRVSVGDAMSDFKRATSVRSLLIRGSYVATMLLSLSRLQAGGLTDSALLSWVLLPLPFLLLGAWEWGRYERQADELQREIVRDANSVAFRWTLVALCVLWLLERAYTLPWTVSLPAGLPPFVLGWEASILIALLVWSIAFVRAHRRRVAG